MGKKCRTIIFCLTLIVGIFVLTGCINPPDNPIHHDEVSKTELDIQTLLAFNGIDAVVDVNDSIVTVRYNQPEIQSQADIYVHVGMILGAVSSLSNMTETVILQPFIEDIALTEIIVDANLFSSYLEGNTTIDEFIKSWDFNDIPSE